MGLLGARARWILAACAACSIAACFERDFNHPLLADDSKIPAKDTSGGVRPKDPLLDLPIRVTRITAPDLKLKEGERAAPSIMIQPPEAAKQGYILSSNKPEIVRVNGREIFAVKKGGAEIRVTSADGAKSHVFKVKVEESEDD